MAEREHRLDHVLAERERGILLALLPGLALIYLGMALVYWLIPPAEPAQTIGIVSLVATACLAGLFAFVRDAESRHVVFVVIAAFGVSIAHSLIFAGLTMNPNHSVTLVFVLVAFSTISLRLPVTLALTAIAMLGWSFISRSYPHATALHWLVSLTMAGCMGLLITWSRRRWIARLERESMQVENARLFAADQAKELAHRSTQLVAARDAALDSDRSKSRFLANVSHEIRTPLNGIIGMLSALQQSSTLSTRHRQLVDEVMTSSDTLLHIVNDLLDISKMDAGALELESVAFDLLQTVEEVAENHANAAHAKGIELLTDLDAKTPRRVYGDPLRLRQVLTNLVSNAIKFTPDGEIVIRVNSMDDGDTRFSVTDTGIGISPEHRRRIFQPFSQADTSTTREYGGTGLGLAICRQLVGLMGGDLDVDSEVGHGATFHFTIRLAREEQLTARGRVLSLKLANSRILVVDANPTTRRVLCEQLRTWEVVSAEAASHQEAQKSIQDARAQGRPFELIVADLRTIGSAWRSDTRMLTIGGMERLVAMGTLLPADEDLNEAGFLGALTKPVRRGRLLETIVDALEKKVSSTPTGPREEREETALRRRMARHDSIHATPTGFTILVAEDNPTNQRVVRTHLGLLGYGFQIVSNGKLALDLLSDEHGFDAVLMDCQMPVMDGYVSTAKVRETEQNKRRSRVPIIALTAHAMAEDRKRAYDAGVDDYLVKPFTLDGLRETLEKWCGAKPLDDAIFDQLLELERGQPGFLEEVLVSFTRNTTDRLVQLEGALGNGNLKHVHELAHALSGSSRQVGAAKLGELGTKMERTDDASVVQTLLGQAKEEFGRVRQAIDARLV